MNDKKKARMLNACIENIRAGIVDKAQCILDYPDLADEIQSALLIIDGFSEISFSAEEKINPRLQKVNLLQKLPDREEFVTKPMDHRYRLHNLKRRFVMAWVIIISTVLSLVSGAGAVYASGEALPGDILYPVKMWTENVQLAIAPDDIDVDLYAQFADDRIDEAAKLIQAGRFEDLDETAAGYELQTELLTQTMARIQADNPDEAVKLRLELEEKLQEQARIMQTFVEGEGKNLENGDRVQEQIHQMLETNTQLRFRINEAASVPVDETEESIPETESPLEPIEPSVGEDAAPENESRSPSMQLNDETGTLIFGLGGKGGSGVYAEVDGSRFDCLVQDDTATCNMAGAPQTGNVKLHDSQTNMILYSYSYEFKYAHGYKFEGANSDKGTPTENNNSNENSMETNKDGKKK